MSCSLKDGIQMKDRRILVDRRKQTTAFLSRYTFFGGQRRRARREADKEEHAFVDHYGLRLFFITLLFLLILSILDAYLTLGLVKATNATEVNPIMALYLEQGSVIFFLEKFLFTSVAVFIFCVFNHFSITRISLAVAIILYLGVVFYEVGIINNFFPQLYFSYSLE